MKEISFRRMYPRCSSFSTPIYTYMEIAAVAGVCWQRIRQLEQRALKKLAKAIAQEAALAGVTPREWLRGE